MYSFITGQVADIQPTLVTIENQGIGYEIEISLKTFEVIKGRPQVKLYIQQIVREDGHYLFGFDTQNAKQLFKKLISVSGIGPNTGRLILSGMEVGEVVQAIRQESDHAFKQVKGVGPKTAKRIILDLKDKIGEFSGEIRGDQSEGSSVDATVYDESLSALLALGFRRPQVTKAIKKVMADQSGEMRVEQVIKLALKALTGGS